MEWNSALRVLPCVLLVLACGFGIRSESETLPALTGSYRGQIRQGRLVRQAVLHVREVAVLANGKSLIASLGIATESGTFDGPLKYYFTRFMRRSDEAGAFVIENGVVGPGAGRQLMILSVQLAGHGKIRGELMGNVLLPNGEILESEFEFQRT